MADTDPLTWLGEVVDAMTPGPWRVDEPRTIRPDHDNHSFTGVSMSHVEDATGLAALRNLAPAMLAVIEAAPEVECCNFPPGSEFNCYETEREPYHDFPCLACAKKRFLAAVREEQQRHG